MRKLFVFQQDDSPYALELRAARKRITDKTWETNLTDLSVELLENLDTEVVVSCGLPKAWYYTLKGMNLVSVTLDKVETYFDYADIVIDHLSNDVRREFTGLEYSVIRNRDFDIGAIVNIVQKLSWDSAFFGFNIAFLMCMSLTENICMRIEKFIRRENIRLVEYLCNCHNASTVKTAEKNLYQFKDIRLTFHKYLTKKNGEVLPDGFSYRQANEGDVEALRGISDSLYKDSRYWFDGGFEQAKIIDFYGDWVAKSVRGLFDHECWAIFSEYRPVAFCTIRYNKEKTASIGLFGLASNYQGRGLGKQLLSHVFNTLLSRGVEEVSVVTQGRNYAAQNLYQSMNFRTKRTQLWYHKWI